MREITWNDKVSRRRGIEWRKNLVKGRLDASLHPTKLKLVRVKASLSQLDVANKVGLSLGTYGAIERSKRTLTYETARKISKLLNTPLEVIFKDNNKGKLVAQK
jgi:DNA-binding XRE family transcriptional regulator